jgi:beta-lactamase class A
VKEGGMTNWDRVEKTATRWSGQGELGASVASLDGRTWSRQGDRRFVAASTIKVPVMIDLYRQVDAGTVNLDERIAIGPERVPGSGVLQHLRPELELTIEELCTLMIAISDNVATNLIVDRLGLDSINRVIAELGMSQSHMGRRMLGRKATSADGENWVTPADLNRAILAILSGTAASAASCEQMKLMLSRQDSARRVTRHAPEGSRWGSKPGGLPGVVNDAGFIETDRGAVAISVCCEDFAEDHEAELAIADIALAAMEDLGLA